MKKKTKKRTRKSKKPTKAPMSLCGCAYWTIKTVAMSYLVVIVSILIACTGCACFQ